MLLQGIDLPANSTVSFSATIISGARSSIIIGDHTLIAFKSLIISKTSSGGAKPIIIGNKCFIGGGSVILPGVTVGNGAIVGAGAVVYEDVPPNSIVVGNPAKVVAGKIAFGPYGRLEWSD